MAGASAQQQPTKTEKKIGRTTYVVISHFQSQGSTAVDKIRNLIDTNIKQGNIRQNI